MRFGYFDFKEIFTERVKATSPQICMTLAALFVCLCPLTANAQARRINGYAVQVAALSSQKSADELAQGLRRRGMNAYWVGGMSYVASRSALHRVRIGNFPTIASASAYAEKLLGAGLLASYAIASYEPPAKANSAPSWKIQNLAQKLSGRRLGPDLIDVVAAIVSLPSGIIADTPATPPPPSASSRSLNAAAPEIGRRELITTTSPSVAIGSPGARSRGFNSPASLQGSIEMRGGRMFMTLRNADPERVFSGVARISLTDDQKQQDVTPINVTLLPDKEMTFPLDEATLTDGGWILMVYDLNGAARLIRGASLGPPKAPVQAPGATNSAETAATNSGPEVPPSYVTGVYDTTNWAQPQVPPQIQNVEGQDVAVTTAPSRQDSAVGSQNAMPQVDGSPNATPQVDNAPGQVTASLRQIAVTSENVTLELEISAQNPLKNVTVTMRAGDFQDVRQAFIPTSQGRVPFLVPIAYASAGLYYEVRDEAQRVLANGNSNLRSLGK